MTTRPYAQNRRVDLRSLFLLTRLHLFPTGSDVCIAPCLWGLLMSAHAIKFQPVSSVVGSLVFWSIEKTLEHSAGCVVNDILDRDVDALVERSKDRPLVSGAVSLRQAVFLALALHYAIIALLWSCSLDALYIGVVGLVLFVWPYPLMKRWTNWPQVWLGITFGWGILNSWQSLHGARYDVFVIGTLWCGNTCWVIVYDTIYACQDRKDDVRGGFKSTAVLFGDRIRDILSLFAAIFVTCLYVAGIANGQGLWYFVISVGGAGCHLTWQLYTVDFDDSKDCANKFESNGTLGWIISVGLLCDYIL